ncbi:hypothetical protein GMD78_14820 [Ornithinibacillus sp. L9]|uniref:Uncharacterized protein n=1 Tax=Ornithinibacillus caprae TaxID=2678566 RepID=A0A6N8FP98_9BACI|nr:hypothetical protein [Ornithinibacillus caprae]MUK89639.1 hypothetical protein [Ornithinibacillus caprae]
MNVIAAKDTSIMKLEEFLKTTPHNIHKDSLLEHGYVVEMNENIKGCFVLSPVNDGVYWLKQLYVSQEEAKNLPVLLETIITMAKGLQAKKLYVHSHQPVVDILLDALQFHPQERALLVDNPPRTRGNWWAYDVS